jgi:hypothetical protein
VENALPLHSFHRFDGPVVYIYPVVVSPMRDMSVALPCCSNVVVHPVNDTLSFTAPEPNAVLLTAPQIPAGMTRFRRIPQESTGMRPESAGINK